MSYSDARQNRTVALAAVVAVHAALGYALLTGLAGEVYRVVTDGPLITYTVPEEVPPPPEPLPVPKLDTPTPRASEMLSTPTPEVLTPADTSLAIAAIDAIPGPIAEAAPGPSAESAPPPSVSLARGTAPRGNQGDWFPPDSYPAAARRAGAEGKVSVQVSVGLDGRVTDCTVTASSGNADLDSTTCRLARRNGRFEPARAADGSAMPSSYSLRNVRWRLVD